MIRTGDRRLIKEINIALVLNVIRHKKPISRADISELTGLGRSTVTGIINTLIREGMVQEIGSAEAPSGRKPVLLTLNERALFAVGVKLAPKQATVALVDMEARVLHREDLPLSPAASAEVVVGTVRKGIEQVLSATEVPMEKLLGIGVVMPGIINPFTGTATAAYFLGWASLPIRDILEQEMGLPVYVDNDANAMALAEALYGAGVGERDLLALTVGVGIGAGVIIGGQIHRGTRFGAGELGHMCVVRDGPRCGCGRYGCLEAVAGDAAIVRRGREEVEAGRSPLLLSLVQGHPDLITRELVVEAAKEGDEGARSVLAEAGRWLGVAVGNFVNLLSPGRVVVGGEAILQAGELILDPIREMVFEVVFPSLPDDLTIVQGALGQDAWVRGAAALVLADAFQVPIHEQNTLPMARRLAEPTP